MSDRGEDLLREACAVWGAGDASAALRLFSEAARLGNADAEHNLGYFHHIGEAVPKDLDAALFWYRKAWRRLRSSAAASNIANVYDESGDERRAMRWRRRAVAQGDGDAMLDLAKRYLKRNARGDRGRAIALLRRVPTVYYVTECGVEEAERILADLAAE